MICSHADCPPGVALLADHLDGALAAGEDLLALSLPARADLDDGDPEAAPEAVDAFIRRIRQLEASLIMRLLQARRLSSEVGRGDAALKSIGTLFRSQTDLLAELISASSRHSLATTTPGDAYALLRSRGLLPAEAGAPSPFETLAVSEDFRIGGIARLGDLLDLASSMLDFLDARFGLYMPDLAASEDDAPETDAVRGHAPAPRQETVVTAGATASADQKAGPADAPVTNSDLSTAREAMPAPDPEPEPPSRTGDGSGPDASTDVRTAAPKAQSKETQTGTAAGERTSLAARLSEMDTVR